jgi:hypothetical protein
MTQGGANVLTVCLFLLAKKDANTNITNAKQMGFPVKGVWDKNAKCESTIYIAYRLRPILLNIV